MNIIEYIYIIALTVTKFNIDTYYVLHNQKRERKNVYVEWTEG